MALGKNSPWFHSALPDENAPHVAVAQAMRTQMLVNTAVLGASPAACDSRCLAVAWRRLRCATIGCTADQFATLFSNAAVRSLLPIVPSPEKPDQHGKT